MRRWIRAEHDTFCGGQCARLVARGQAILELVNPDSGHRFLRCPDCAGEPVPQDLPVLQERPQLQPTRLLRLGAVAGGLDWKVRQAGDE